MHGNICRRCGPKMPTMKISINEAKNLAIGYLVRHNMQHEHAEIVADHLVYASLAGHEFAGLSRLQPIVENLETRGLGGVVSVVRQTEKSAMIDGANVIGYVTSLMAIDLAVDLAKKTGIGIVGVNNSWFSGMLRYYVERAAQQGMVAIHAANSTARVAPHGSRDRLLGTNPIAFAFPTHGAPLVVDLATASIAWGDAIFHQQTGRPLPEGRALDNEGKPTTDPLAAIAGTFLPWGGVRGSSLSVVVQALGILAGSDPVIGDIGKWGYLFLVIDPSLLMSADDFKDRIASLRDSIERSQPLPGTDAVRAPGSGGAKSLASGLARGWIEVADEIYQAISL